MVIYCSYSNRLKGIGICEQCPSLKGRGDEEMDDEVVSMATKKKRNLKNKKSQSALL